MSDVRHKKGAERTHRFFSPISIGAEEIMLPHGVHLFTKRFTLGGRDAAGFES